MSARATERHRVGHVTPVIASDRAAAKRALLIVNRHSRAGRNNLRPILTRLEEHGLEPLQAPVGHAFNIPHVIRTHADQVSMVIIGGGDGTMNAAAGALIETGLPLGIVPLGTANDLARTLGIPPDPLTACDIIGAGHQHVIDLGLVNDKHFFNVASMGLSVEVSRRHVGERKRRLRQWSYLLCIVEAVRATRTFRAEIRCDDRTLRVHSIQLAVGNGRHYGGGLTVADDAAIDDQRLDLYTIEPLPLWRLAGLVPALRWGKYGRWKSVLLLHGRDIEVRTSRPLPINTDGEVTTSTPAHFQLLPQALTVFVPAGYDGRVEAT